MKKLKRKLADLLSHSTRAGIRKLKPDSHCFKTLQNVNIDCILTHDVEKICESISLMETVKILSLSAYLKCLPKDKRHPVKEEIKDLANQIVKRTEKEKGALKIPHSCRHLLLNI